MANVGSRLKAPKSASTKKGRGKSKKSLAGVKDVAASPVKLETDTNLVSDRRSHKLQTDDKVQCQLKQGQFLKAKFVIAQSVKGSPDKNIQPINKTPIKKPVRRGKRKKDTMHVTITGDNPNKKNILEKIKKVTPQKGKGNKPTGRPYLVINKEIKNPPMSKTKSGRIKKKNKAGLKLIDDILKSELMILEGLLPKSSKRLQPITSMNNNNDNDISDQNSMVACCEKSNDRNETRDNDVQTSTLPKISKNSTLKEVKLGKTVVHELATFECDHCKKTFNGKSSLRRHMYGHLGKMGFACPWCKKQYMRRDNLQNHVDKLHTPNAENCEDHICHICLAPFLDKESLNLHMIGHVKNEKHKCIYCEKKFAHQFLLVEHEKQHLVTGRHQCTLCNKNFTHRNQMHLHLKRHLNIKDYICYACGKVFLRKNSLSRHEVTCHGDLKIQCRICKKYLKGHLSEHMRTHDDERPHECPDCGQRFRQSTQLTVHRRSHSGDKPYQCRICNRSFTYSNALMMHIRRHTGEKPFVCAMCPNAFTQLPHMKAHMMKIHGQENPYKCAKCHQFFKLKSHLDSHADTCTVGDIEMSFEEKLNMSFKEDDDEVVSVMSLSRMRFLLALLLTMIASDEKLKLLGFNKRLIDDLLVEALEAMGCTPLKDESLSPFKRLKANIDMLMIGTVPKGQMEKFRKERKTTEELLELLTFEK